VDYGTSQALLLLQPLTSQEAKRCHDDDTMINADSQQTN